MKTLEHHGIPPFKGMKNRDEAIALIEVRPGFDRFDRDALGAAISRAWPYSPFARLTELELSIFLEAIDRGRIGNDDNGRTWRRVAHESREAARAPEVHLSNFSEPLREQIEEERKQNK